jgi:two-component system sensor histidine kinase/response regulator
MNNLQIEAPESILIVDDTPADLRLLSKMLTQQGYDVRAVTSGPRALESVRATPPDLILLDVKMPEMNGYEVCQRLKIDEHGYDIPIIFISALGDTQDKITAFATGGVDYVTKPFQVEEVLARVETHLGLRNLQTQIQRANSELEKRIEELDSCAHIVSHDLRVPLDSIVACAESLAEGYDTLPREEIQQKSQSIIQHAHQIVKLIDDLLTKQR